MGWRYSAWKITSLKPMALFGINPNPEMFGLVPNPSKRKTASQERVRNCFGNSFFFSGFFFFLVGGGFGAVQAPFWENPGVKGRFVRVFQDIWGWF